MADNFLEKRYDEVFGRGAPVKKAARPSLDALLLKVGAISKDLDTSYVVHPLQMKAIVAVNEKITAVGKVGSLRFHTVCGGSGAFIGISSIEEESPDIDIALGISIQSMCLKAVEMGLAVSWNCDPEALKDVLEPDLSPLAVLRVGKPEK